MTPTEIAAHLNGLAKPPGSLGRLEELAAHLCRAQGTLTPKTTPRRLVLFAADHGVVAEGVTAWPAAVTQLMVQTIAAGRAASSVLAASTGTDLRLVDVGTLGPAARVRAGSRNLAREPALTVEEFCRAAALGEEQAAAAATDGMAVVAAGEMGIGNTTPASCLTALLTGSPPEEVVGLGAGADAATLARKQQVVEDAVDRVRGKLAADPVAAIAAVGGLEIAAMAGFYRRAAALGLTTVLDGFIATAALLVADRLWPGAASRVVAAHRSAEPGHAAALRQLGLKPVLDNWGMRLGEGTGALVVLPLLDAAAAMTRMATLREIGAR